MRQDRAGAFEVMFALKAAMGGWVGWRNERLAEVADFVATRLNSGDQTSAEAELLVHAAEWTAGWLTENGENEEGIGKELRAAARRD